MAPLPLSALSLVLLAVCPPTWCSGGRQTWGMTMASPLPSSVSSGKSHNLSAPHFPPVKGCCADSEMGYDTNSTVLAHSNALALVSPPTVIRHNNSMASMAFSTG